MANTLLPRNQDYYDRLAAYVTDTIGLDNQAVEEMLADIHADLLQAQADGIGASDYFGKDPQAIARELIANLPRKTGKQRLVLALGAWALSFGLLVWHYLSIPVARVPFGSAAVLAVFVPLVLLAATAWFRRGTFTRKRFRGSGLVWLVVIQLVIMPMTKIFPYFGQAALPNWTVAFAGFSMAALLVGAGIWLGLHSWLVAAVIAILATSVALPAADSLGTLPGWWGRLLIPGMYVGFLLLVRVGVRLWPSKWQAKP